MDILHHPNISPDRKRPFAHFLINVYFSTDEEDDHSEISSLVTNPSVYALFIHLHDCKSMLLSIFYLSKMWDFLEHISTLVENIRIALQAIPHTEHQKVCDAFLPQSRSTSMEKQTTMIPAIRTTSRTMEYVTSDGGELKPG